MRLGKQLSGAAACPEDVPREEVVKSRTHRTRSAGCISACKAARAGVISKANSAGIRGSPCSPPSACTMRWTTPASSLHRKVEGWPYNNRTNGRRLAASGVWRRARSMACPDTINRKDSQGGVHLALELEAVCEGLGASTGNKCILGAGCNIERRGEVLSQSPGNGADNHRPQGPEPLRQFCEWQ